MVRWAALVVLAALLMFTALPARAAVTEAWVQHYNGAQNGGNLAYAVALDGSGNVVVTGHSGGSRNTSDYYTAKYAASDGALLWEKRYNSPSNFSALAYDVAVDGSGNVVVTGWYWTGINADYATVKYAAADGTLLWEKRYNGPANGDDIARAVVVDGSNNVIVTGSSFNGRTSDYYTAKYASVDGALMWEKRHNDSAFHDDRANAMAVDGSGNVIVTGYSGGFRRNPDYYTVKYAAADGAVMWEQRYNGPANGTDCANAVAVDGSGNVVVTGQSAGSRNNFDYYTTKYAAADGALLWEQRYNGPANTNDYANAVAVDGSGNVVVTGFSFSYAGGDDYYTAKYAAVDGALLWEQRYNGPANSLDYGAAVAVDGSGNVVVTGYSFNDGIPFTGGTSDYYTAKYAATDGALLWDKRYNGPGNSLDLMFSFRGLAISPDGSVVVTGSSSYDYATVVYRESFLPPVITCPTNTMAIATSSAGIVVHFTVTATDDSGVPPSVTCAPASGSVFPIGQTTVICTASDGDGLSSTCSFTVTVRGARGIKQSVLAELLALRATVTDRDDGQTLDESIAHLTQSLAAEFWVDETHLERKHGGKVFHEEKEAVRNLCDLIQSRKSQLPDAVLQGFVDQLFQADRLLASVAIEEAIAAGVSGKKIEQAQKFLARGDAEAVDGKCANGIEEYRKAWKRAARAKVSPPVCLANGCVRLEIAGEPGERFTIQCSTNLKDWTTLGTRTANMDGVVTFEDADAGPHRTRFYRAVEE